MLSKCANPGCAASFLYLHEGKLFRLDSSTEILVRIPVSEVTRPSRRFEFFWLCDQCAAGTDSRISTREPELRLCHCSNGLRARRPYRRERPARAKVTGGHVRTTRWPVLRSDVRLIFRKNLSSFARLGR